MISKKSLVFIVCMFTLSIVLNFASAEEVNYSINYDYGGVQVTYLKSEPYPANPGEYFDIWIKASIGNNVDYVKFKLLNTFPFSMDISEDSIKEYEDYSGEVVMHYKVRVDEDSVEGINQLNLQIITSKAYEGEVIFPFEIYVANAQTDFDLVIQDSSDSEISLAIANIGKNTANSMIVRIPEQEGYTTTGTSGQMVGNLDSGDYTIVSFDISKNGRIEEPLLIQIDYTDSIGERRSMTKEINFGMGIVVSENITSGSRGIPESFGGGMGDFPGQQTKAKWPYILAVSLILIFVSFFVYEKYKRQIKKFIKEHRKGKEEQKKAKSDYLPEWMIKETNKINKKR